MIDDTCGKEQPVISVITPSYNQGEYIEDTILSVLNQDYPRIEHIVVDGGSTDGTHAILRKYQQDVIAIVEQDDGQVDAIMKGLRRARGSIVTWLNSDDIYVFRDTLSIVANLFLERPKLAAVSGCAILIDRRNRLLQAYKVPRRFSYEKLLVYDYICQPATFVTADALGDEPLNRDLDCAFDYELWLALGKRGEFMMVPEVLAGVRRHESMKTIRLALAMREESTRVRQSHADRKKLHPVLRLAAMSERIRNKVAGVRLLANVRRHIVTSEGERGDLAVRITVDGALRSTLRQIVNHRRSIVQ